MRSVGVYVCVSTYTDGVAWAVGGGEGEGRELCHTGAHGAHFRLDLPPNKCRTSFLPIENTPQYH